MSKKLYLLLTLLLAMTLMVGCFGTPTTPPGPSQIVITPSSATVIYGGGTKQFSAVCTDTNGNAISGATFAWSVDPPSYGTIDQTGLFTAGATKNVQCEVVCSYSGITKRATVNIGGLLTDYGQQIVADAEAAWGNMQEPLEDLKDVITNTQTELAPKIAFVNNAMSYSTMHLEFSFLMRLFSLTPGTYTHDQVVAASGVEPFFTGTWTVTDDTWTIVYTRSVDSGLDTVTIAITNSTDTQLDYHGTSTYTTAYLTDPNTDPKQMTVDLDFDDQNILPSTYDGTFSFNIGAHTATLVGNIVFNFSSTSYLRFNCDWNLALDPASEDRLVGTFETENLALDGGMRINWAHNDNIADEYYNLFPRSITFGGSIEDKGGDTTLVGSTNLTISNAATFDPNAPESPSNFLLASMSYTGSIENAANKIEATIRAEDTAYQRFKLSVLYNLTNGGVVRNFTVSLENNDVEATSLTFELSSSWGNATVSMDLTFDSEGQLTNVTGEVTVDGAIVGTISFEAPLITVTYTNGEVETF